MKKQTIRVTKIFGWEMSHALWNYDGLCSNMHGHSYVMHVTIKGSQITDDNSPKCGMVIDFGDLKRIVKENIVDKFDHSVVLNTKSDVKALMNVKQMFDRIHIVNFQPTAENLVVYFADIIKSKLPENIELHSVRLYETATSYAEWFAEDN
jgi:6-pyruvoyltetrahydropterin/6-carboxytetrahydropterin synthase